jgi:hypothetical protein
LRRALQSWEHAPKAVPPTDLADRILLAALDENARLIPLRNRRIWSRVGITGIAATAAAVATLMVALNPGNNRPRPVPTPGPIGPKPPPQADLHALNQALADASDATWELAYVTSAPAVRLGRHVFDDPAEQVDSDAALFPAEAAGEVVSEVLSRLGAEISAGVRPLSDSARRAFNYLQRAVPQPGEAIETSPPSATKGT